MTPFAVIFDYLCPFARNAAEVVVRAVEASAPTRWDYRGFSLPQVHLEEGAMPVWEAEGARPACSRCSGAWSGRGCRPGRRP